MVLPRPISSARMPFRLLLYSETIHCSRLREQRLAARAASLGARTAQCDRLVVDQLGL